MKQSSKITIKANALTIGDKIISIPNGEDVMPFDEPHFVTRIQLSESGKLLIHAQSSVQSNAFTYLSFSPSTIVQVMANQ